LPRPSFYNHHSHLLRSLSEELTPPQFYILKFYMEAFFTPLEFQPFFDQKNDFGPDAQAWLREMEGFLADGNPILQPFFRQQLFPGVDFYQDRSIRRQPKTLLISFAGFYMPLGLSTAVFLQMIASEHCDTLLLNDGSMLGYEKGIPGYANSYEALIAKLKHDFGISRYQYLRLCGMSRGGYASLRAATDLCPISALSIGGSYPILQKSPTHLVDNLITQNIDRLRRLDLQWYQLWQKLKLDKNLGLKNTRDVSAFRSSAFHITQDPGESNITGSTLINVYSEQSPYDTQSNAALQQKFAQLESYPIAGVTEHNLAYVLLKQKQLNRFLKRYLFP